MFGSAIRTRAVAIAIVLAVAVAGTAASGASAVVAAHESPAIKITRMAGADAYATSAALASASGIGTAPHTGGTVFLATGANYWDALHAAPIAAKLDAPLLLTAPTTLPASVAQALTRLAPAKVVLLGSTSAVSTAVQSAVHAAVPAAAITRVSGSDGPATGRAIVRWAMTNAPTPFADGVYLATGGGFPDGLAAAAVAGARNEPLLLVPKGASALDAATMTLIRDLHATHATIAGGTGAVSSGIQTQLTKALGGTAPVTRLAGADTYATSLAIARTLPSKTAFLASGTIYPDALAGAAAAGRAKSPLIALPRACVPTGIDAYLHATATSAVILGGGAALASTVNALVPCSAAHYKLTSSRTVAISGSSPIASLDGVSCPSASRCIAVGTRSNKPFAATLVSGTWKISSLPLPSGYVGPSLHRTLSSISCASATRCVASGSYVASGSHVRGVVGLFNGSTWSMRSIAAPAGSPADAEVVLHSVSCAGTSCTVAGELSATSTNALQAVAIGIEGTTVTTKFLPGRGRMAGASCTATAACVLGGTDWAAGTPLTGSVTAGAWVPGPDVASISAGFTALTCESPGECTARTDPVWSSTGSVNAGAIAKLDNGVWTQEAMVMPAPAGTYTSADSSGALDCAGMDFCGTLLFASKNGSAPTPELALAGNHKAYAAVAPLPSGATPANTWMTLMACPRAGTCIAVGGSQVSRTDQVVFVEVLSNGVWSVHTVPHPAGQKWVEISANAISCPTTTLCHIVGYEDFIRTSDNTAHYAGFDDTITF